MIQGFKSSLAGLHRGSPIRRPAHRIGHAERQEHAYPAQCRQNPARLMLERGYQGNQRTKPVLRDCFNVSKSEMLITTMNNGAQILFAGLDDVEKIKSITPASGVLTDIWIEEATETSYDDLKQLEKATARRADIPNASPCHSIPCIRSIGFSGNSLATGRTAQASTMMTG